MLEGDEMKEKNETQEGDGAGGVRVDRIVRQPLPEGTKIEYRGLPAMILDDNGGSQLLVWCEHCVQTWEWEFEGYVCSVVA
jgi:hypothetical protein